MEGEIAKKNLAIFLLSIISSSALGPVIVSATELKSQTSKKIKIENKVENSRVTTEKKNEYKKLLENIDGEIIGTSNIENTGVKEYSELSKNEKNIFAKNAEEILEVLEKNLEYENDIPKLLEDKNLQNENWEIYQKDNDILVKFPNFSTYLVDNEYINYIEPVKSERGGYTYKYTSKTTNKEWVKALDTISLASGAIGWRTKSAVAGGISLTAAAFSYVGQRSYKTFYKKTKVYVSNSCPFKGKKIVYWYQYSNYSGRTIKPVKTYYTDNTTSYQKC